MDLIAINKNGEIHLTPHNPYDYDGMETLFYMFEAEDFPSYPVKGFTIEEGSIIDDRNLALIEGEDDNHFYVALNMLH